MRFLLDTHAWLWSALDDPKLGRRARATLAGLPTHERVGISAISLKEASWHLSHGRIVVRNDGGSRALWLRLAASSPQLEILPLTVDVAIGSEDLPSSFPADPADRIIAATARLHGLTL